MKPESIVFAIAGACFGLIVGWVLGSQSAARIPARADEARATAAREPGQSAEPRSAPSSTPVPLDAAQVQALRAEIARNPGSAAPRARLGNLYFDAERYDLAIEWYTEALKLDPRDANVSTDLGVSYYYTNQPDRALKQFDHSLSVEPTHAKTILNLGIVRAFGKQDLEGAAAAWQQVITIAPQSPEAQAARRALESLKAAHPGLGSNPPGE